MSQLYPQSSGIFIKEGGLQKWWWILSVKCFLDTMCDCTHDNVHTTCICQTKILTSGGELMIIGTG